MSDSMTPPSFLTLSAEPVDEPPTDEELRHEAKAWRIIDDACCEIAEEEAEQTIDDARREIAEEEAEQTIDDARREIAEEEAKQTIDEAQTESSEEAFNPRFR